MAEQVLERVGEAVLQRMRRELSNCNTLDEPLRFTSDVDTTSQPPSIELRFENTFNSRQLYQGLPADQQFEVFTALHSSAQYALSKAEPQERLKERDVNVYVFDDQSAVELIVAHHRQNDPLFFPAVRAISWQKPMLLVGNSDCPTEMNLHRLGYQEAIRTPGTTLYRHYDPAMPLIGYGYAEGHFHVTVFNDGQTPAVMSIPGTSPGAGQLVDLRQRRVLSDVAGLGLPVTGESAVGYKLNLVGVNPRYPVSLLDQVARQYAVELTGENAKRLLNGQKTDVVKTGSGSIGKLYVLNTPENGPQLVLQDVRGELKLKESYLGHVFSDKDKQNLHKYGDMGRAVELVDKQSGQKFTGFIGVDKDIKTLTVLRADVIRPKIERMTHLKGVPLNGLQKQRLIEGKAVRLDKMTSKAGTTFSAYVRVSAASRSLRFDHIPTGQSEKNGSVITPATNASSGGKPADATKPKPARRPPKANS